MLASNYVCSCQDTLEKYLPWSENLPDDIRNYAGDYEELKVAE